MKLSPLYLERLSETTQSGIQQGMQQGMREERRTTVENLLRFRFGWLDDSLLAIAEPILELPPEEFASLLLQLSDLSREELLARFGGENLSR